MPDSDTHKITHLSPQKEEEEFSGKMKELKLKELEQQTQMQAFAAGMPFVYLVGVPIVPSALSVISEEEAKQWKAVCFDEKLEEKKIGVVDKEREGFDEFLVALKERTHSELTLFLMSQSSFDAVLKLYAQIPKIKEEVRGVQITESDIEKYGNEFGDIRKVNEKLQSVSLTEVVTILVALALKSGSSDIHIEAEEHDVKIRLRVDGILHDIATLPSASWKQLISRVKLLSGLKINVSDRPQDGRFTIFLKTDKVDVRVSTLPTAYGESVVMRLLRSSSVGLGFDALGLTPYAAARLKKEIEKPNGMIVTTGPTGSGKTTTLYAILNDLNSPEIKIITLEDPVEYKLAGINQSQIDASKGYTFAGGLRSILRQDPDVVMVGEIRDGETADIAINAALTGHLVISTIHTNSAAGAIPRFLAMGAKAFLLAPALSAVMGQRLVRRLCQVCKKPLAPSEEERERVKTILATVPPAASAAVDLATAQFFGPGGCDTCLGLGYKGRVGIYEIMPMNKEIEAQILSENVSEYAIAEIAIKGGMVTMVQDGVLRAIEGVTSLEEVFSVAQ